MCHSKARRKGEDEWLSCYNLIILFTMRKRSNGTVIRQAQQKNKSGVSKMENFIKWFAESKIASWFRVFLAVLLSNAVLEFSNVGAFDFSKWEAWVIAALSATLPTLLRVINPEDGLGAKG